ncbi:MAG: hypothetical protein EP305_06580 [Bacteroidetes bacterium]|nr:MAG: hypothetical protein EP305_06580 [Bacteroidota bacterium]
MTKKLLWFIVFLLSFPAVAQRYSFMSFNTAQGLPQSQVSSIVQDEQGYLWVGTLGGLAKFNGKEFETFTTESGLLNNRVTFLTVIDDVLWIGHEGGVSSFDGGKIKKYPFETVDAKENVSDIVHFGTDIIIASNGAGLYRLKGSKLEKIDLKNEAEQRVRDLEIADNELLIGTRDGILITRDLIHFERSESLSGYSVSSVKKHAGQYFVSTFRDGIFLYNLRKDEIKLINSPSPDIAVRSLVFDSKGQSWYFSTNGITRFNEDKVELSLNESNGLPMESIQVMYEDNDRNFWLGTEGKGLIRYTGERFIYYNKSSGMASDLAISVDQTSNGDLWIGTFDKGLLIQNKKGEFRNLSLQDARVWSILTDLDGYNWLGTENGLIQFSGDQQKKTFYIEDGTPGDKITALFPLSRNTFYIGGNDGVSIYRSGKITPLKSADIGTVRSFCRMKGETYCGTDKGIYKIRGGKVIAIGNFFKTVFSMVKDSQDRLWIGTAEGLLLYDGERFKNISYAKSPASNYINFLSIDNDVIYVGTNNGLFQLQNIFKEEIEVLKFGIGEGVSDLETNLNSSFIDNKHRLWFGTASGLVCYRPEKGSEIFGTPRLVLKKMLLNYQDFEYSKYSDQLDHNGLPLTLDLPSNKNNITFELDGIALANYQGLKFQYKLEGIDENWSPLVATSSITYSALPEGDYVFVARAVDSRGNQSDEIRYPFTVRPPFYRTWWFILLSAASIGLLLFAYLRFRLKREREANEKERLEYRSRLLALEQRSLNASMNRHFIFNSLNSIQYFINTQDKLSANKFLTNFAKLIRKNLDSSEEGNVVTLAQELDRLELYLSLESMRFKDRFEYVIDCDEEIDKENIRIPAMILQPFVENSIIHGILPNEDKKGEIKVEIHEQDRQLIIRITDNGVGIENSIRQKQDIEGDHKSQGMEITSKRIELLNHLSQNKFEIQGPFQMEDEYRSIKGTGVILKISLENLED